MSMTPFDVVKSIVPTLTPTEKDAIAALIGTTTVCGQKGHKLKTAVIQPKTWRDTTKTIIYCERCDYREEL